MASKKSEKTKKRSVKVKVKLKGGPVAVHNAIKKLATGGESKDTPLAKMKVTIKDGNSGEKEK